MSSAVILSLLGVVYLMINVVLPRVPMEPLLRTYLLQPVLWGLLILAVRRLPPNKPIGRVSSRSIFVQMAFGIALGGVVLYMIGGLYSGFGRNPSSRTLLGITENVFFVGSMLTAMELSRAWLINRADKRHRFAALALVAILFTFIGIPLGQVTGFRMQIASANLVLSSWLPLLAENLLASVLVLLAGTRASLAYRVPLAAFWWLCPILPDLTWGLKAVIGIAVPITGIMMANSYHATQANRGKSRRKARATSFPAGWVATGLVSVVTVWFAVGVFPFRPSLVGSGSMSPTLKTGDVVIVAKVPAGTLRMGDIIEYRRDEHTNIVHRVIDFDGIGASAPLITKGDANSARDDVPVMQENVIGKVVFNVPRVGWISIFVKRLFGA
jgi:signal peptidase